MNLAVALLTWVVFFTGSISIYISLAVGWPFKLINASLYRAWVDLYKRNWSAMLIHVTKFLAPSKVEIYTASPELAARFKSLPGGHIESHLASRAVVIANHQLYNDWAYLWWLAYTSNLHGGVVIALKRSLRSIPIFGWAMRMFRFLFLSRKWAEDESAIKESMTWLASDPQWSAWLLLFPEGTVVNSKMSARSHEYYERAAGKNHLPHPLNMLLPRTRGLFACLQGLDGALPTLYDVTIFYEGIPEGVSGEVEYSLKREYLEGHSPPVVRMHIREFAAKDIPYKNSESEFSEWLFERWQEKDQIFEQLSRKDAALGTPVLGQLEVKGWGHFYGAFNVPVSIALLVRLVRKALGTA